ncbi:unnamed protein product [Moneuplotes crassus]|uniref:CKK domain-containing protein n=1 Tax=Euplotes crassus TaxID=5936 RepID=A0AAD2D6V6_EUPCR|nr:unnamed protein product [Moneuplotes crassus]
MEFDKISCNRSSKKTPYIDFNATEGMKPLEQSNSDQNCDPESITEEEIALIDEHVLKNIHRNKSKLISGTEDHLEKLIKNRNSEIFKESNNKVQKEIKQKMENLQRQIETKHKRHQEDNMNKQKAALDLIRKKTEISKIKALQKFSSNIRYSDNDPELGQYYSESYQNCGLNFPEISRESNTNEDDDIYEEEFEAITEEAKDHNTSQTGKEQSHEENSHSSNLGTNEQNSNEKTDIKVIPQKIIEEEKAPPARKESWKKQTITETIVEKRQNKIVEEVRKESNLPKLPPVSPNVHHQTKARLIQTADDIRMPKIENRANLDNSQNVSARNIFTPKGNNFAVKRPYEDIFKIKNPASMYRTMNGVISPNRNKINLNKNNTLKKKYSLNSNENKSLHTTLEVTGDNMFSTFRRDTYQDHQILEKIVEDDTSEDAIIECSNEQDDWKESAHLKAIKKNNAPNKNFKNHRRYKFSAKIQPQKKIRNEVKTPVHKTRTAIHLSFGTNPGKTHHAEEQANSYLSPNKTTSLKTARGLKERRFPKQKINKFSHLFDKGNYNTMRMNKSRYSMENTSSVRPPTYKVSPRDSRVKSRDSRGAFKYPRTPANFSVKKISVTRESSVEEVKQYDIKANKGKIIRKMVRPGIRKNSKIRDTRKLTTSASLKVTGVGGDTNKSKEILQSARKVEKFPHKKIIKTIITKICFPRGKKCKTERKLVLDQINNEEWTYFAVLFGKKKLLNSNNFRGVYKHACGTHLLKIYGDSFLPNKISCRMIESFFKYDRVLNKLMPIPTQSRISEQFHAFILNPKKQTTLDKADDMIQNINKLVE